MNRLQFIISLAVAVCFTGAVVWNAVASQGTAVVAARQMELQTSIEKARMQQRVLEQLLQRTAALGQNDPDILAFLGKYGLSVKVNPADDSGATAPAPASGKVK